jgi:fructose-1,6-bisphosphatase/inositol monophosphatase family enzyme
MAPIHDLLESLRRLHDAVRDRIIEACQQRSMSDLAAKAHDGAGDIIYAVDHVSEAALIDGFQRELDALNSIVLVGEGLPNGRVTLPEGTAERDARWRIIVDPIDGTRGFMYQKRPAWILTGVAPNHGQNTTLADIQLAIQTEIPLLKQHLSDQLWAIRGQGAHAIRHNRLTGQSQRITLRPSTATDIEHGYATVCRYFPGGRDILAALDDALCYRLLGSRGLAHFAESSEQNVPVPLALGRVPGAERREAPATSASVAVFEDQQCTAGQLYGLATGQDRFVADLRPLVQPIIKLRGHPLGHCCHPYDLATSLIAQEAGVILTTPDGHPLDAPLDTDTDVAWLGYANRDLQSKIEPVLRELLGEMLSLAGR